MDKTQITTLINSTIKENNQEQITAASLNGLLHEILNFACTTVDTTAKEKHAGTYKHPDGKTSAMYAISFETTADQMQLNTPWSKYASIPVPELDKVKVLDAQIWLEGNIHAYASIIAGGYITFFWQGAKKAAVGKVTYLKNDAASN